MITVKAALARRFASAEEGFALIMVMGIGLVLMLLMATAVTLSVSDMQTARGDQNWAAAESAAYAGVADYEAKLTNNNTYYLYGNPASTFTPPSTVTLPPTPNKAFGLGANSANWATVPGGDDTATYRYEVDNTAYASTGIVRLRSTGRVGNTMRSIVVNVRQHGFVDFMYFTKYELGDPIQNDPTCVPTLNWQTAHAANCSEIQFAPGDTVNGPVHSNDTVKVCGSTFLQGFESSNPVSPYYEPVGGCAAAQFAPGSANQPQTKPTIEMPATNGQLAQEVRTDLPTVPNPGCLYTGPTNIVFNGDGTMTVKSPFTRATNLAVNSSGTLTGTANPMCGPIGTVTNGLGTVGGATIPVIQSNLIFVQDVQSTPSTNPNYWANGAYPPSFTCINSSTTAGWTFGSLAYPMANESVPSASPAHYSCRKGDVYVSGTMQGKLTIAVDSYIYVTGDLKYQDASANADMLGLIGNNAIWVWNPVKSNGTPLLPAANREIDAAVLSLGHTFLVQNYDKGGIRGTLTVYGAIAQKFRGPVGTGNSSGIVTGYTKNYNYDKRLQYQAPPKFLSPVAATYQVSQLVEVSPPFNPDGSSK
jgi:hypothetical protein